MSEIDVLRNPTIRELRNTPSILRRTSSFGEAPMLKPALEPLPKLSSRWTVLILSGLLLFGNYYAFDLPASLNAPLQKELGVDYEEWQWVLNLMYSSYSFPNMFLPAIGGHLIDHYDVKKVLFGLSFIVCLGQLLFSIGVYLKDVRLMIFGRFIFGIGGESIAVSESTIVTSWFTGKELAFALGMNLCVARLGSVANSVLSPKISNYTSPIFAVWCGTFTCILSFASALLLIGIISVAQDVKRNMVSGNLETTPLLAQTMTREPSFLSSDPTSEPADVEEEEIPSSSAISEITQLPLSFWMLCIICILLYGTVVPFNATASDFLMSKWYHNDIETAGLVMSIPDLVSFCIVPFFGYIVDHYGHRITWLVCCAIVISASHLTMGISNISPVPSMIGLGLGYAIYGVVLWPSIATSVQHREWQLNQLQGGNHKVRLLGTAFGFSMSALNTALTVIPLLAAQVRIAGKSFVPVEYFYSILGFLGIISGLALMIVDSKNESVLQTGLVHEEADAGTANVGESRVGTATDLSSTSSALLFRTTLEKTQSLFSQLSEEDEEEECQSLPASIAQKSMLSFMNRREFDSTPVMGTLRAVRQGFGSIEFSQDSYDEDGMDQRSIE